MPMPIIILKDDFFLIIYPIKSPGIIKPRDKIIPPAISLEIMANIPIHINESAAMAPKGIPTPEKAKITAPIIILKSEANKAIKPNNITIVPT